MWQKIQFFNPEPLPSWAVSHFQAPTALIVDVNTVRVFFATRDSSQTSRILACDLRCEAPDYFVVASTVYEVLAPGSIGHFDEHGVYPSCIVMHDGRFYLFYIGWNQGMESPLFYSGIGMAISNDGKHFFKHSPAPIMARSPNDPCLVTSPYVYDDAGTWHMHYVSGIRWERNPQTGKLQSFYHIQHTTSSDLLCWQGSPAVSIGLMEDETNVARASVLKTGPQAYHMWYCYLRQEFGAYRMGYAQSKDGEQWQRMDAEAGIGLDDAHCTQMICYPHVFTMAGNYYMLYNGDNFGKQGFGIARCTTTLD